jgi:hypothetical protein
MEKLFKIYATGLVLTAAVATSAVVLFSRMQHIITPSPTRECYNLVKPEKNEWERKCQLKNSISIDDSVFEKIEEKRIKKSELNNCDKNLEQWLCILNVQTNKYEALFYNKNGK